MRSLFAALLMMMMFTAACALPFAAEIPEDWPSREYVSDDIYNQPAGQLYTTLVAKRGTIKVIDSLSARITTDGGGINSKNPMIGYSANESLFEPTMSPSVPYFFSTSFSMLEPNSGYKGFVSLRYFVAKFLGGAIFINMDKGVLHYHLGLEPDYNFISDHELTGAYDWEEIKIHYFDQVSIYQYGRRVLLYFDGELYATIDLPFDPSPGQVGFLFLQIKGSKFNANLHNTYLATGKLAWGYKEAIRVSHIDKQFLIFKRYNRPTDALFDINVSVRANKSKNRTLIDNVPWNPTAESRSSFQAYEISTTVKLKDPAAMAADKYAQFPIYIDVSYYYNINFDATTIINNKDVSDGYDYPSKRYFDRQYVLESPNSVINDTFYLELRDSYYHYDSMQKRKIELKMLENPELKIVVTGLRYSNRPPK